MSVRMSATLISVSIVLGACSNSASFENAALDSDDQKASYGIGLNVGQQLVDASERLDRAAFMRGIEDALQGSEPDIEGTELDFLKGSINTLKKNKIKILSIEIMENKKKFSLKEKKIHDFLEKNNFKLIKKNKIRSISFLSDLKGGDYLFYNERNRLN